MNNKPCRERVFPSKMAVSFEHCYLRYAHWLKHLLERLGREPALEIWAEACICEGDELLTEILATGWEAVAGEPVDVQTRIEERLGALYGSPVQGVTVEGATELVEKAWPIKQVRQRFSDLNVVKAVTVYEFLHLFRKGLAM